MKIKVIIEETISQEFEVEVSSLDNAYDEIRGMYRAGKLFVDNPTLIQANLGICDESGQVGDWNDLHV